MTADTAPPSRGIAPEVFQHIGTLARRLHDTVHQLGLMPGLQSAAAALPDARCRLGWVAQKTADAAHRVLDAVDAAKAESRSIVETTRRLVGSATPPAQAALDGLLDIECRSARIDAHLTDIMLAQDFHDLTGQVVARIATLTREVEGSLVELLLSVAPTASPAAVEAGGLRGPVIDDCGRPDVVSGQGEVDELLAKLGF